MNLENVLLHEFVISIIANNSEIPMKQILESDQPLFHIRKIIKLINGHFKFLII